MLILILVLFCSDIIDSSYSLIIVFVWCILSVESITAAEKILSVYDRDAHTSSKSWAYCYCLLTPMALYVLCEELILACSAQHPV